MGNMPGLHPNPPSKHCQINAWMWAVQSIFVDDFTESAPLSPRVQDDSTSSGALTIIHEKFPLASSYRDTLGMVFTNLADAVHEVTALLCSKYRIVYGLSCEKVKWGLRRVLELRYSHLAIGLVVISAYFIVTLLTRFDDKSKVTYTDTHPLWTKAQSELRAYQRPL